jgi:putative membrane-bound dehydrogenase-like protein
MKIYFLFPILLSLSLAWLGLQPQDGHKDGEMPKPVELRLVQNEQENTLSVFRAGGTSAILTQVAKPNFRPYLHPIVAPDGKGLLTEYSPGHHKHQTGIYWGFTRVNGRGIEDDSLKKWFYRQDKPANIQAQIGRDYFHHPEGDYWKRVDVKVIKNKGETVKWETVYDLLDSTGNTVLTETQTWTMREEDGRYLLNLEWAGEAQTDVTIGKFDYGGLFVRMPWKQGIKGEVVNAARQHNQKAEGQRANWVDVGMQVEGRSDLAHIAVFDHPDNKGFPQYWRVDGQLGIGPARQKKADWQIKKGKIEVIKYQLVIYTGVLDDVKLSKMWSEFSGQDMAYSLWGIAQQEGRDAKFLTPDEAVANMTLKEGFKANVWASEPMITQPMAFCWDDKGRLWIAENRDYESRGYGFSNAGNSRILIIEDTNHDGIADSKKVFLEGIAFPAAMAVGFDGLFLGAPPNLLFVPDKNHDDIADMNDIEVRLTGWGIRDRHETLNSLHWGPDGWLYGCQGFATPSKVRKPEGKGRIYKHKDAFPEDVLNGDGVDINGGVWRYHPTKDKFEVVAHGFSNPWGIDYDAKGQLFISACVIPHIWHVIPGGIYHRQGGQHFNPYIYSDIRTIGDHSHRSAHGGARVYQSDAFPAEHKGRIFMANIHEHAVLSDILQPKGSGFVAKHGDELLMANNAQWVGFSMEVGPDGGLYVLDWHDADICGKEVLNGETGRIFRIMPKQSLAENWATRYTDLNTFTDKQLVELQKSPSDWHARRARVILQNRAHKGILDKNCLPDLRTIFKQNTNADFRLRAMWALHITNNFTPNELLTALTDTDAHMRAWAIQLLCEDKNPSNEAIEAFVRLAKEDPSPVVRLYLASALQRINEDAAWRIVEQLAVHGEDANDHNLPKMLWFGLEPLVKNNPNRAIILATNARIPLLAQYISRRLVDANLPEMVISSVSKTSKNQTLILEGMRDGLEGRFDLKAPKNWSPLYAKLKRQKGTIAELATQIAQRFGDTEVAEKSMATLKNKKSAMATRQQAIKDIAVRKGDALIAEIPNLINEPELRLDVIQAIAQYNKDELGQLLVSKYKDFTAAEKQQALQTLSSRPKYGWQLTQAIKNQLVPKKDVPAYTARQLLRVVGSGFIEVWGPIEQEPSLEKAYSKYQRMITDKALGAADATKGVALFQTSCGSCHKMYGKGGNIGPDLTGSNRGSLDYLLFNVLNPSGEIQEDYKLVVVTTRDGRTYSGNVVSENTRQLTMRIVGQEAVVINKSDIQSREVQPTSLMPIGLFDPLSESEVLDLVKYLQTFKDK